MLPIEVVVAELERQEGSPALTVYLRTDGFRGVRTDLSAELAQLLEPVRKRLPWRGADAAALEMEARLVEARLESVLPGARGVAVFSSSRAGVFRLVPLDVPVPASAHWGEHFDLKPLRAALDAAPRLLVAVLDRERARFFRVTWGEIEEMAMSPVPAVAPGEGEPAWAHVAHAAEMLRHLTQNARADRLLVCGGADVVAELRRILPGELAERLECCAESGTDATAERVLESVLEQLWRTQHERDSRLVDELLRAVREGQAAMGAGNVTEALAVGDVQRLVVPEGLHLGGGECPMCGMLAAAPMPRFCPACGAPLHEVGDLVERLEVRVARGGGTIDEVGGQAAALLAEHEGIGAFLRVPLVPSGG